MERLRKNNIHTVNLLAVCLAFQLCFFKNSGVLFDTLRELINEFGISGKSMLFTPVLSVFYVGAVVIAFCLPAVIVGRSLHGAPMPSYKPELPFYPFYILGFSVAVMLVSTLTMDILGRFSPDLIGVPAPLPKGAVELGLHFLCTVIIPAVFGELFFRGVVLRVLLPWGRTFAIFAASFTGAIFADDLRSFVLYTALGMLTGYFVTHVGSIWIGVFISVCGNISVFIHDFILDEGLYYLAPIPFRVALVLLFAFGVFGCIRLDTQLTKSNVIPLKSEEREVGITGCLFAPCVVAYYIVVIANI